MNVNTSTPIKNSTGVNGGSDLRKLVPLCLMLWAATTALSFYAGVMIGMQSSSYTDCMQKLESSNLLRNNLYPTIDASSQCHCNCEKDFSASDEKSFAQPTRARDDVDIERTGKQNQTTPVSFTRFSPGMATFAGGAAYTKKEAFMKAFDYGYPQDTFGGSEESDVLLLYNKNNLPVSIKDAAVKASADSLPFVEDSFEATANCPTLSVMLTKSPCLAIMWHYESYQVEKWARLVEGPTDDLKAIGRGKKMSSRHDNLQPPSLNDTRKHWSMLHQYLEGVDDLIYALRPLTERIAINNTIIVMVCNHGQSPLLMNFACSSRSRGLDISNILVFATDLETLDLAESLGMTAYFDEKNFGDLPNEAASAYGDRTFTAMMFAKVVSVQIINFMGYDVLFQDVDIHWYKNPLDRFHDTSSPLAKFDMLFQDDGSRSQRYEPYYANSGFYYVRHNDRTRHLLTSLLVHSDMIVKHASHQQILIALLADHSSLTGLRVKVLSKDDFPGGFDYHRKGRWDSLRKLINGDRDAEIFHMSWTHNKTNKLLFMRQMGMCHLKDECEMKQMSDIKQLMLSPSLDGVGDAIGENSKIYNRTKEGRAIDIFNACCSLDPIISCHYKDKPSVVNCNHKDPIGKNGKPFWIEEKS